MDTATLKQISYIQFLMEKANIENSINFIETKTMKAFGGDWGRVSSRGASRVIDSLKKIIEERQK